jgi:predicted CXXCH cytochrome family protein
MLAGRMTPPLLLAALLAAASAPPRAPAPPGAAAARPARRVSLAPLPAAEARSSHAPYEAGDCSLCHVRSSARDPGPTSKRTPALCVDCHGELAAVAQLPVKHPPAVEACTQCHNPHNSAHPKMLHEEVATLCFGCHGAMKERTERARVKHGALTTEHACASCHNPHGSELEKLLVRLPFDLCMRCHGVDDLQDWKGKKLMNMKRYLEENSHWHAPVAGKDCSVCHEVHGGENFRLLVASFPPTFYAPFDLANYALCFTCHDEQMVTVRETTTLTGFRNGKKNLHFVHVNQSPRGRTCRACHEVHASSQEHHIREGVPYGEKGYILKLHYTPTPTGGECARTCHPTRAYANRGPEGKR